MSPKHSMALIPARGGSKRLPDKMLRRLGGLTLVQWAVEAVMASGCFERVVVSSDSEAILETVLVYPVEARHRPAELATDEATTMQVLLDLLRNPERHPLHPRSGSVQSGVVDLVALCQPTTPFRTADDLRNTVKLLTGDADAAIAVMAAPVPPQRSFAMRDSGECVIPETSPLAQGVTRKQLFDDMYTPNGAAYVSRAEGLQQRASFFTGKVYGHVMPRERSLDIDDDVDWQLAEIILGNTPRA